MKILDFTLQPGIYDAIARGELQECYKRIYPHTASGMLTKQLGGPLATTTQYDAIRIYRGTTFKDTLIFKLKSIQFGFGLPEWGAPIHEEVLIYKLDKLNPTKTGVAYIQDIIERLYGKKSHY